MSTSQTIEWQRYKPALKRAVQLVILALVVWGLTRTWQDARDKFAQHQFSLADLHWPWLAASCGLYMLATLPAALFWRQALVAMGQRPGLWEALRAYYVSQLGKYVPGKALVVVIRAGLVRSPRVDGTVAALSVFVETLTLMAVGAVVAAVILAIRGGSQDQQYLTMIAIALGLCAGVPSLPPLFRAVVRRLPYVKSHPAVAPAVQGLKLGLMARGWVMLSIGWLLMGMSLWAATRAIGEYELLPWLPLLTASVALATVAGFMSLIPGGLGVRELIVTVLLIPAFGEDQVTPIVAAVLMRLVSLVSEVVLSTILYFLSRPRAPAPTASPV